MTEEIDTRTYLVVINDEEQYSIWAEDQECPAGWHQVGVSGDKTVCLDYIDRTWTDMRPRSLREHMAAQASKEAP